MNSTFNINKKIKSDDLILYEDIRFDAHTILSAVNRCNEELRTMTIDNRLHNYTASFYEFDCIPKKNVSGYVGEAFGKHLCALMKNDGIDIGKNPCEAGSPDFIIRSELSTPWFEKPISEYCPYGGFETKGTFSEKKKFTDASASSHHDQTVTILSVQWTFSEDHIPEIIGIYYTGNLKQSNWKHSLGTKKKKITNMASLTSSGIKKLRNGWIVLREDVNLPKSIKSCKKYGLDKYGQ